MLMRQNSLHIWRAGHQALLPCRSRQRCWLHFNYPRYRLFEVPHPHFSEAFCAIFLHPGATVLRAEARPSLADFLVSQKGQSLS